MLLSISLGVLLFLTSNRVDAHLCEAVHSEEGLVKLVQCYTEHKKSTGASLMWACKPDDTTLNRFLIDMCTDAAVSKKFDTCATQQPLKSEGDDAAQSEGLSKCIKDAEKIGRG